MIQSRGRSGSGHRRASLREMIEETLLTDSDFEAFCLDHFPQTHRKFGISQDHIQKLNSLLTEVDHELIIHALRRKFPEVHQKFPEADKLIKSSHRKSFLFKSARIVSVLFMFYALIWAYTQARIVVSYFKILLNPPVVPHTALPPHIITTQGIPSQATHSSSDIAAATINIGLENSNLQIFRILNETEHLSAIGIKLENTRTRRILISAIVPISDIKAWVSSPETISLRHPVVRELAIDLARQVRRAAERSAEYDDHATIAAGASSQPPGPVPPPAPTRRRKRLPEPTLAYPSGSAPPPAGPDRAIATSPDTPATPLPIREQVDAPTMMADCLYHPTPELPALISQMWMCTRVKILHNICIDTAGSVSDVETIQSIPGADEVIRQALFHWKFRPRPRPACFQHMQARSFVDEQNCTKTVELPAWRKEFVSFKLQTIVASSVAKDRISGSPPILPEHIRTKYAAWRIVGAYRLCLSAGGSVFHVSPVGSIDRRLNTTGADAAVMTSLRSWRYEYRDFPVCFVQTVEF